MTNGHPTTATSQSLRWIAIAILMIAIAPSSGCRICTSTEDLAYPSYGGAWQRTIRDSGRVGSLFDPAGARASELVNREDPITADEIERNRRDGEASEEDKIDLEEKEMSDDSGDEIGADPDDSLDTPGDDSEKDAELDKLKQKLRDQEMNEVKVIPGDPLPPLLR